MKNSNAEPKFALYHKQTCPYCHLTRRAIKPLDLDIELRDILLNSNYRRELIKGGGKQQVPCLRIESAEGDVQWLYESADIIQYLKSYHRDRKQAA